MIFPIGGGYVTEAGPVFQRRDSVDTCTRIVEFCAGHRVMGHENKCSNLHGHQYKVELHASGPIDGIGRIVDFSVLKLTIGHWIEHHWDHGFLLHCKDDEAIRRIVDFVTRDGHKQKHYLFDDNPTAENLASFLLHKICPKLLEHSAVRVVKVVVWETPNCYATAELDA
jgi:6-pyruvoyltetrahydropterin/6-carboxytetrahydropterin synthase